MASTNIVLPVPKELQINTNQPNSSSVVIDTNPDTALLRRSQRATRSTRRFSFLDSINQHTTTARSSSTNDHQDSKNDPISKEPAWADSTNESRQTNHNVAGGTEKSIGKRKRSDSIVQQTCTKTSTSAPFQASSILTTQRLTVSSLPNSVEKASLSPNSQLKIWLSKRGPYPPAIRPQETSSTRFSRSNTLNGKQPIFKSSITTKSPMLGGRVNGTVPRKQPQPLFPNPNGSTLRPLFRKPAKRRALEAHLLVHDNYGNVRYDDSENFAPANHHTETEKVKTMFHNEALMRRLEGYRDERRHMNESEKKLWDLGETVPWVRRAFTKIEEYHAYLDEMMQKKQQRDMARKKRSITEKHSGDTTEEDENGAVLQLLDAAHQPRDSGPHRGKRLGVRDQALLYGCGGTAKLSALADMCISLGPV